MKTLVSYIEANNIQCDLPVPVVFGMHYEQQLELRALTVVAYYPTIWIHSNDIIYFPRSECSISLSFNSGNSSFAF